jgi:thymidylate synthase (FAD)
MKVIKPYAEIIDDINGEDVLKKIELVARTCYKSEDKIKEGSAERMVANLIKCGHEAMLEHFSFSVRFVVDRGVTHEIVRHRVASFAQESTRYCNYGGEVTFIEPPFLTTSERYGAWLHACEESERCYQAMLNEGGTPQEARSVLSTSVKTELIMTANIREWRHFFKLRAVGTTGAPHPQMKEVTVPLLQKVKEVLPVFFDDIEV